MFNTKVQCSDSCKRKMLHFIIYLQFLFSVTLSTFTDIIEASIFYMLAWKEFKINHPYYLLSMILSDLSCPLFVSLKSIESKSAVITYFILDLLFCQFMSGIKHFPDDCFN